MLVPPFGFFKGGEIRSKIPIDKFDFQQGSDEQLTKLPKCVKTSAKFLQNLEEIAIRIFCDTYRQPRSHGFGRQVRLRASKGIQYTIVWKR